MHMRHNARRWAATALLTLAAASSSHAIGASDGLADYVPGFAGSTLGDLDVLGAYVTYNQATDQFVFVGTMAADIGLTPGGLYVWGLDRGGAGSPFAANGVAGVHFNAVVIINADGSGRAAELGPGGATHSFAAGTAKVLGSTLAAQIDGSWLRSTGAAKTAYTWNLWPRDGSLPAGFGQISDFAPDNSNLAVTVIGAAPVPEPSAWALLVAGLGLVALRRRRG